MLLECSPLLVMSPSARVIDQRSMVYRRIIGLVVEDGLVQTRWRPPARVRGLSRDAAVVVLFHKLEKLVKVAAFVHRVEVGMRAVMREHPVGRDGGDVSGTHERLAEEVDAVV